MEYTVKEGCFLIISCHRELEIVLCHDAQEALRTQNVDSPQYEGSTSRPSTPVGRPVTGTFDSQRLLQNMRRRMSPCHIPTDGGALTIH